MGRLAQTDGLTEFQQDILATVRDFAYRGAGYAYRIAVPGLAEMLKAEVPAAARGPFPIGSTVRVSWDASACLFLQRTASSS